MIAKYCAGAVFPYFAVYKGVNGVSLGGGGNYAKNIVGEYKGGDGKGKSMGGNKGYILKAAVVYLLPAADFVKGNHLDNFFVVKFGHMGIVEGDMPVFAYSHADYIRLGRH